MKILKYSHNGGKEANLHFAQAIKQKVFDLWKGTQLLLGILFGKHQSSCDFKMKLPNFLCLGLIFMSFSSNAQIYFEEYYREKEAFEEKIKSEESAGNTQLAMQIREKMIDFILRHEGKLSPDYAPAIEELCNTSYFEKTSKAGYYRKENERLKIEDERFGEELRKWNEIIDNDKKNGAINKLFGDYRDLLLFLMREQPKHIYVTNEMKNILSNDEILDETKKFKILEDFLTNVLTIDKVGLYQWDDYAELCEMMYEWHMMIGRFSDGKEYLQNAIVAYQRGLLGKEHPELEYLVDSQKEQELMVFAESLANGKQEPDKALQTFMENPNILAQLEVDSIGIVNSDIVRAGLKRALKQAKVDKELLSPYFEKDIYARKLDSLYYTAPFKPNRDYAESLIMASIGAVNANMFNYYPEKEQQFIMRQYRINLEANLSYILRNYAEKPELAALAYDQVLLTNNMLINQQQWIRQHILLSKNKEVKQAYQAWNKQRLLLNSLYTLSPQELQKRDVSLIEEEGKYDDLEEVLHQTAKLEREIPIRPSWKAVQEQLRPREAAVEILRFFRYDRRKWSRTPSYIALIITAESAHPTMILLDNGDELESTDYQAYNAGLLRPESSSKLYDRYWAPIQRHLGAIDRVFLAFEGIYHHINPATLRVSGATTSYLIDMIHIVQVGSTREIIEQKRASAQEINAALLIGNPLFDWSDYIETAPGPTSVNLRSGNFHKKLSDIVWNPLPETENEVHNIEALLKKHKVTTTVLLGKNASEWNVKELVNPEILHIATHGFFNSVDLNWILQFSDEEKDSSEYPELESLMLAPLAALSSADKEKNMNDLTLDIQSMTDNWQKFNPALNSGLVLAGATNFTRSKNKPEVDDGILTAYEVNGLDLRNTELVVLSACETGRGQIRNGDGIYGLHRSFLTAGTRCLITSLWKVNDDVTQLLMTNFYLNWFDKGLPKQEAFRQAQLQVRRDYPEPFYWGAFIMLGQ
jgi:CHAT domain-containing protein